MIVYIPTLGRIGKQPTADAMKEAGIDYRLVCRKTERNQFVTAGYNVLQEPEDLPRSIGHTRQFIMEQVDGNKQAIRWEVYVGFECRGKRTDTPFFLTKQGPADIKPRGHGWRKPPRMVRLTVWPGLAVVRVTTASRGGRVRILVSCECSPLTVRSSKRAVQTLLHLK